MSPRTVWLASYPKSGNTWMRAIVTALGTHPHLFQVNQLGSGAQPFVVAGALPWLGLDSRWLDRSETDRLRTALVTASGTAPDDAAPGPPVLRKTHEVHRPGMPGAEPFPAAATRAAILVVRDPRDVACSYAPFFGVDLDTAVEAMGTHAGDRRARPALGQTAQPWGTWSSHAASWLDPAVPFPVHLVRYEDLQRDAVATLGPVFAAIGLDCTTEQLASAVDQARFDRLRCSESADGFREVSPSTERFFRRGAAGGWRTELSESQVAAIEADHGEMMQRLGYEPVTAPAARTALAEARSSRRRSRGTPWFALPAHLGLEVTVGPVPDELPGATSPVPWIRTTATATRVRLAGGGALLVEDGRRVTVEWPAAGDDPDADPSWTVQGWAVTVAALQRGLLSLHASTVRIGDEVVAIAGRSGAGKSTTAMALRARGHLLLVDDTTIVDLRPDGAWATPYARNVHLLPDAAASLGVDPAALPPLAGRHGKHAYRPEPPPTDPVRIDRIVVLRADPTASAVDVQDLRGSDKVTALAPHTRRYGLAPAILGPSRHFELLTRLADATSVQVLTRLEERWSLDEVVEAIEAL